MLIKNPKIMKPSVDQRRSGIFIFNLKYFTPFSTVFIVDFEQVNVCWGMKWKSY